MIVARLRLVAVVVGVLSVVGLGRIAAAITIPNFSFETDQVAAGTFSNGNASWTHVGDFGRFHGGGDLGEAAGPTNGTQIAFFNTATATAIQDLVDTYQPLTNYTFLIDIASREAYDNTYSMLISLYADGVPTNTVGASLSVTGADLSPGDVFKQFSFTVTATDVIAALATGQTIGIRLMHTGNRGNFDLDNIRLNITSVPEPSSIALLAIGAAFVWWLNKRRSASH